MRKINTKILKFVLYFLFFAVPAEMTKAQWALPNVSGLNLPTSLDSAILNLTNWLLGFVASIAVIYMIWGGIKYISSTGNQQSTTEAKAIVKYALMGLVVAGISYALVVVFIDKIL